MYSKQTEAYFTKYYQSDTTKFLKGRYIGECVRIISDLMDKLEDDIPGLLMLVDFEKAFDTVE